MNTHHVEWIDHNDKIQYRGGSAAAINTLFLWLAKQYENVTMWHNMGSASTMVLAEKLKFHNQEDEQ